MEQQQESTTGQQERRKSDLQKALEADGWKWLTNEQVHNRGDLRETISSGSAELVGKYMQKGFSDVLVTEAHDNYGLLMDPNHHMRAVYVRGNLDKGQYTIINPA